MTAIAHIQKGIRAWEEPIGSSTLNCETEQIIGCLNRAFSFGLTQEDVETWVDKNPESIHLYMALHEQEMKFVLIDSESDKTVRTNTKNIIVASIPQAADVPRAFFDFSRPVPPFGTDDDDEHISQFKLLSN